MEATHPHDVPLMSEAEYWRGRVYAISPESLFRNLNEKPQGYTRSDTLQACVLVCQDQPKVALFWRNKVGQ